MSPSACMWLFYQELIFQFSLFGRLNFLCKALVFRKQNSCNNFLRALNLTKCSWQNLIVLLFHRSLLAKVLSETHLGHFPYHLSSGQGNILCCSVFIQYFSIKKKIKIFAFCKICCLQVTKYIEYFRSIFSLYTQHDLHYQGASHAAVFAIFKCGSQQSETILKEQKRVYQQAWLSSGHPGKKRAVLLLQY